MYKQLVTFTLTAVSLAFTSTAFSHTRLETPTIPDNTRVTNNVIIGHGCGTEGSTERRPVIGTSVVFPDGADSTIIVDGQPYTGSLGDFVTNWGNIPQQNYNRAVFDLQDEKADSLGNVVGFWAGGNPLPANLNGYVPFRVNAVQFNEESCVSSVKFYISIVDICEITPTSGFSENTVGLWTHNSLGTPYDRQGTEDDGPASLTVTRTSALPASCGTGQVVEVKPSAAQINRDMPINYNGQQVWPQ